MEIIVLVNMIVAIWKVHAKNGFWSTRRGYELNGLIIAASASLLLTGPGKVSVDGLIFGGKKDE